MADISQFELFNLFTAFYMSYKSDISAAIMKAYDNIPISVEMVIGILQVARKKNNTIPFPENFDLVCAQHFHTEGYSDQKIANAYAMTYLFQGSSDIRLEDRTIPLTAGDIFFATPGFDYKIRSSAETFSFEVLIDGGTLMSRGTFLLTHFASTYLLIWHVLQK